jgi:hypothetical protein
MLNAIMFAKDISSGFSSPARIRVIVGASLAYVFGKHKIALKYFDYLFTFSIFI